MDLKISLRTKAFAYPRHYLGGIPLALATGAGAESRQQIARVLVGGLLGGTFFTLFAVLFIYMTVKGWRRKEHPA